jgi:hypothetical protein
MPQTKVLKNPIICSYCGAVTGTQGIDKHIRIKHPDRYANVEQYLYDVEQMRIACGYKANPYGFPPRPNPSAT